MRRARETQARERTQCYERAHSLGMFFTVLRRSNGAISFLTSRVPNLGTNAAIRCVSERGSTHARRARRPPLSRTLTCALIVFPSHGTDRVANSTPIVDLDSMLNSLRVKRESRLDLPTPESPIKTTACVRASRRRRRRAPHGEPVKKKTTPRAGPRPAALRLACSRAPPASATRHVVSSAASCSAQPSAAARRRRRRSRRALTSARCLHAPLRR